MKVCPECKAELGAEMRFCPYDGSRLDAASSEPRDPMIGRLVGGRYRITAPLGTGGMARVYLAHHSLLERQVALKVLHPALASNEAAAGRFAREARAASRIAHDNVVYILDFGLDEGGFHFLVMEHVAGRLLDDVIADEPLPAERAMHVLSQIAAGLARAHRMDIVHRDLKPQNVMLCERGSDRDFVKILDFGLSRPMTADGSASITRTGQIFGTPDYMAPEQWHGQPCDARTDIYALGMTAYEMVTGTLPFEGNPMVLMVKHLEAAPPPPSVLVPDLLPSLDAFVLRCLAKAPADRFQTMEEVLAALGQIWRSVPPKHAQTTYTATLAAPPPPRPDEIPDVTVYQTSNIDVAWDGPSLCEELRRLHQQRGRRLGELLSALYGADVPAEVAELRRAVEAREPELDRIVDDVRSLQVRMEEIHRLAREEEGELRAQLIDASLAIGASDPTLFDEGPAARLRQVERRIASVDRRRSRQWLDLHAKLTARIGELGALEADVAPKLGRLGKTLKAAVGSRLALRPLLVEFQKIDGAMAAYHALLGALEEVA